MLRLPAKCNGSPPLPPASERKQELKVEFSIGDRIGKFRVVREIGHDGMGCVYEVVADDDVTHLALKAFTGPSAIAVKGRDAVVGALRASGCDIIFPQ